MIILVKLTLIFGIITFYLFLTTKYRYDKNILKLWLFGQFLFLLCYFRNIKSLIFISHYLFWICLFIGSIYFNDKNHIILILLGILITAITRYKNQNKDKCLILNIYGHEKEYFENKNYINKYFLQFKEIVFLILTIILVRLIHRKK